MEGLWTIMIGYFFGFGLGVGCALAVMYTIYTNGYKKGIEHSLLDVKPARYYQALSAVQKRLKKMHAN
jgi:hypothetical protein